MSNEASRAAATGEDVAGEAATGTSPCMKTFLLKLDTNQTSVEAEAREWTDQELGDVQSKIQALQAALWAISHQRKKSDKEEEKVTKKRKIDDALNSNMVIPTEALRQVSVSGFLLAEDLGRFLLCTCQSFSKALTSEFVWNAVKHSQSDRLNSVPKSILHTRGPKWVYDEINKPLSRQLIRQPTTLSAENLTLVLKLFVGDTELFSLVLSQEALSNIDSDNEHLDDLTPEAGAALLERVGTTNFDYHWSHVLATMHGFRQDTNQVTRLMRCVGGWDGYYLHFRGTEYDFLCLEVSVAPPDPGEGVPGKLIVENVFRPEHAIDPDIRDEVELDPDYSLFPAIHHFPQWTPEVQVSMNN